VNLRKQFYKYEAIKKAIKIIESVDDKSFNDLIVRLVSVRKNSKITQKDMAKRIGLGVNTVNDFETLKHSPDKIKIIGLYIEELSVKFDPTSQLFVKR
jgi:transcriptional regulator with XRE-family HTH domain